MRLRRRSLLIGWPAAVMAPAVARAQSIGMGGGLDERRRSGAGGSTSTTTWSTTDLISVTLSNANLTATGAGSGGVRSSISLSAGKYYWEYTLGTFTNGSTGLGIATSGANLALVGNTSLLAAMLYPNGTIYVNGSASGSTLGAVSIGNVIGMALDVGGRLIWFRVSPAGNWNGSGTANPATGTGGLNVSALTGNLYACFGPAIAAEAVTANFGASGFSGTAPSGFVSWA